MTDSRWHEIQNVDEVDSPALLIYPDRVAENIHRAIEIAGSPGRLRPHIKTHKLPEVIRMHTRQGVVRFKCATISEAEMAAEAGARDILLAAQPVGVKVPRLFELVKRYPGVRFSTVFDCESVVQNLALAARNSGTILDVLLDLDCGMHRTGVEAGPEAMKLYQRAAQMPGLRMMGLHVYDGHIHDSDLDVRKERCAEAIGPSLRMREMLIEAGAEMPSMVLGGTPTFPIHAEMPNVECSPGTYVLWDAGYSSKYPDLPFSFAALVLTRVISKPASNRLCFDLGHKAVASESPMPRVVLFGLEKCRHVMHSEEHLVVETPRAAEIPVGTPFYAAPWHVCPTVALHREAAVVVDRRVSERWYVRARDRRLSI